MLYNKQLNEGAKMNKITKNPKYISIIWSVEDVKLVRSDITDDQASIVLCYIRDNHDANIGINWDVITECANDLYPIEGIQS